MKKTVLGGLMFLWMFTGISSASAELNDKDCGDFSSHQEVMEFWYSNGFNAVNDPHRLDGDGDGLACEVSQSEYDRFIATNEASSSNTEINTTGEAVVGEELPETASSNTLIMLMGAGVAAAGCLLLFRRKQQEA